MKICIVGYGSIGKRHHGLLKKLKPDSQIIICDKKDGFEKYENICDEKFDLVVICTPTSLHLQVAVQFVNSKSFFIEKPLDDNLQLVERCFPFFEKKKTMIGCNMLFSRFMAEVKENLPNCSFASVKAHTFLPKWRENHKELYSSRKELGGGALNDYFHEVFYVAHILGLPNKITIFKKRLKDYTIDTDDYVMLIYEYDDKIINIECSYLCKEKHRYCDMTMKNGERRFIDFTNKMTLPNQATIADIDATYERQWEYFFGVDEPISSYGENLELLRRLDEQT